MTPSQKRLIQLSAFLAVWLLIVVGRLAQVQIAKHDEYVNRATKQQERTISLTPVRGSIRDARGRVLAESVAAESIYADPQAVTNPKAAAVAIAKVKGIGVSQGEIEKKLRGRSEFAWIARQVDPEVAAAVKVLKISGIYSLVEHRRVYPKSELAANILGYVSVDGEGLSGAEHAFEKYVAGRPGKVTLLRDARRGMYLVGGEGKNAAVDGMTVVLTIDEVIQFITERALQNAVEKYHAAGGSAIVMDPNDGSILAMASSPTFDPNRFREFSAASWRNHAIQDLYEPGSTFKIVTASAALEEGVVTPSQIVDCGDGSIEIARVRMHEHGGNKYGQIPFEDVIVHSSNVGTIKVGLTLGPRRFYRYISRFGFGARTGVELPGEASGILRSINNWSLLSNAAISIGQEIGVTPLQIARATAVVANGGSFVAPHVLDSVVDSTGAVVFRPSIPKPQRILSARSAAVLNEILKAVVARGTGQNAAIPEHVVAGKTGTAQKATRGGYSADKFVASFSGYVPADRPRLVILVVIDEPKGAQYGGTVAAPAFREIAEATLRYLRVPPSLPAKTISAETPRLAMFSQQPAPAAPAAVQLTRTVVDRRSGGSTGGPKQVAKAISPPIVLESHRMAGQVR